MATVEAQLVAPLQEVLAVIGADLRQIEAKHTTYPILVAGVSLSPAAPFIVVVEGCKIGVCNSNSFHIVSSHHMFLRNFTRL